MKIATIESLHADAGQLLSDRPGWGTDINEAAVRTHPPASAPERRRPPPAS